MMILLMAKLHIQDWTPLDSFYEMKCMKFIQENITSAFSFGLLTDKTPLSRLGEARHEIKDHLIKLNVNGKEGTCVASPLVSFP